MDYDNIDSSMRIFPKDAPVVSGEMVDPRSLSSLQWVSERD